MAQKGKTGPMETECRFSNERGWEFTTGEMNWNYRIQSGINLYGRFGDSGQQGFIFAKNIDHAVMFAQCYEAGVAYAKRSAK